MLRIFRFRDIVELESFIRVGLVVGVVELGSRVSWR